MDKRLTFQKECTRLSADWSRCPGTSFRLGQRPMWPKQGKCIWFSLKCLSLAQCSSRPVKDLINIQATWSQQQQQDRCPASFAFGASGLGSLTNEEPVQQSCFRSASDFSSLAVDLGATMSIAGVWANGKYEWQYIQPSDALNESELEKKSEWPNNGSCGFFVHLPESCVCCAVKEFDETWSWTEVIFWLLFV